METFITNTLEFLKGQSIQVAIVFVGVLILTWLLQNKSAHVRYLLWLLVAIKCLTPPLVIFSVPVLPAETIPVILPPQNQTIEYQPVPIEQPKSTETVTVIDKPQQALPVSIESRTSKIENPLTSTGILLSAWTAGAACYLLWALGKAVRLGMQLRRIRKPLPAQLMIEQIEMLAHLWNYPGGFKVWLVDGIAQPFVWGLWRGAIYLPTRFQSIQGDKQKAIVLHEMAHVVRLDAFVNLIQILIQGVFWFHPLVWLANKSIRQEREKCCDEIAVARLGTAPKEYGSAIVDTLLQEAQAGLAIPTLAVAGPVKNIEDRIKTIMQPGKRFFHRPSTIALLVIGLLAVIIIPTTIALTQKPTPPDYTLSGSVTNAESGQPIAGAIVFDDGYGPEPYQKGITDEGGKFEYKSWNEEHNIAAKADGYKSQGMTFTTFPFDNSKNLNFKLQPVFSSLKVEAGKSGPPFIAALPDGVTVELLGICDDVSKNNWWKPDGTPFVPEKLILKENGVCVTSEPYQDRVFLAKITGPDGMNCGFGKILGFNGMLSLQIEDSNGNPVPDLFANKVHLDTDYELTDVTIRVAAGPWKTLAVRDPDGGVSAQGGITFAGIIEKDEKIIFTASDDMIDMAHCLVAIDKDSKEYSGSQSWSSAGKTRLTTAEFKNLALDRVKEFQFRVRPYQQVEFKNVSLKPNLKTDVKVEILPLQDGIKQNQARAMEIFDNPKFKKRFFVTIVVDKNNEISGDGQKVTAEQFEALMPQCPDPAHTVLEVAFEPGAFPDIHTQYKNNPVFQKAGQWVEKYHLEYLSYVGEDHPESRRGPLSIRIEDAFETDKVIAVGMPAVDLNADKPLLTVNTIVFSSNYSNILADINMAVISLPKRQWEIKVRLLDKDGRQIDSIVHKYQKSSVILGVAAITNETLTFNFGTLEISKIAKFEIEVRQIQTLSLVPGRKTDVKIETDSSAAGNQPPVEPITQNPQFTAVLPEGTTVEIIGVCTHPSKDINWWKADGSISQSRPYSDKEVRSSVSDLARQVYEFAFLVHSPNNQYPSFCHAIEGAQGGASGSLERGPDTRMEWFITGLPNEIETTTINVGIATGTWTTQYTSQADDLHGVKAESESGKEGIIWMPPTETNQGKTIISVSYAPKDEQAQLIAVDHDGVVHTGQTMGAGFSNFVTYNAQIDILLKNVKEFQFQTRPYRHLLFKNVSLKPGKKTVVKIEVPEALKKTAVETSAPILTSGMMGGIKNTNPTVPPVSVETYYIQANEAVLKQAGIDVNKTYGTTTLTSDDPNYFNFIKGYIKNMPLESIVKEDSGPDILDDQQIKQFLNAIKTDKNTRIVQYTDPVVLKQGNSVLQSYDQAGRTGQLIQPGALIMLYSPSAVSNENITFKTRIFLSNFRELDTKQKTSSMPPIQVADIPYQATVPSGKTFWILGPQGYCGVSSGTYPDKQSELAAQRRALFLIKPTVVIPQEQSDRQQLFDGTIDGKGEIVIPGDLETSK